MAQIVKDVACFTVYPNLANRHVLVTVPEVDKHTLKVTKPTHVDGFIRVFGRKCPILVPTRTRLRAQPYLKRAVLDGGRRIIADPPTGSVMVGTDPKPVKFAIVHLKGSFWHSALRSIKDITCTVGRKYKLKDGTKGTCSAVFTAQTVQQSGNMVGVSVLYFKPPKRGGHVEAVLLIKKGAVIIFTGQHGAISSWKFDGKSIKCVKKGPGYEHAEALLKDHEDATATDAQPSVVDAPSEAPLEPPTASRWYVVGDESYSDSDFTPRTCTLEEWHVMAGTVATKKDASALLTSSTAKVTDERPDNTTLVGLYPPCEDHGSDAVTTTEDGDYCSVCAGTTILHDVSGAAPTVPTNGS